MQIQISQNTLAAMNPMMAAIVIQIVELKKRAPQYTSHPVLLTVIEDLYVSILTAADLDL